MKLKVIAAIVIISCLSSLNAQACVYDDQKLLDYIRRENNRCEGIKPRIDVSGSLRLVSLATRNIKDLDTNLTIKIPRINNNNNNLVPEVVVRAINSRYQLDRMALISQTDSHSFSWSTYVIQEANIPINSLRATATAGSQTVYIPVIIGQPNRQYELAFVANRPTRFLTLEVRRNGQVVYQTNRPNYRRGEIIFTWDGRNEVAGRYELYYKAELEQIGRPSEQLSRSIVFEHDPSWLR